MASRPPGDKPLTEPMMVILPTHICVTRPRWVNTLRLRQNSSHFSDIIKVISNSLRFFPKCPDNNSPALVQINDFVPNKQQAFMWTNGGLFYWYIYASLGLDDLTHWGRDKMDAIYQTTFSNAISWMKMYQFRLRFHWSLFPRVKLTIFQH